MRSSRPPRPLAILAFLATATTAWAAPVERLSAAGRDASAMADVWWWTAVGSATVWLAAVGFLVYCWRARRSRPPIDAAVSAGNAARH